MEFTDINDMFKKKKEKINSKRFSNSKNLYCIYCGQDENEEHLDNCPIIRGIPKGVRGINPLENDMEYNLNLGRYAVLTSATSKGFGTGNIRNNKRLAFELIAFNIRRILPNLMESKNSKDKFLIGWHHKNKINKIEKLLQSLRELAEYHNLDKDIIEKLMKEEKILIANYSDTDRIPLYRNEKTKQLIYE